MDLAKPALDIGLYVADAPSTRTFLETEVGLPYEELLPVGGGVRQHRFGLRGSVLKVNESRNPLQPAPSGYRRLLIADAERAGSTLTSPEGLEIAFVDPGDRAIEAIGVEIASADPAAHERFFVDGFGATRVDDCCYKLATTVVVIHPEPDVARSGPLSALGFRYLTVQVRDVAAEHARLVDLGIEGAMPPRKLGEVAMISFVRDPGGNWFEISQRASLTGELPS